MELIKTRFKDVFLIKMPNRLDERGNMEILIDEEELRRLNIIFSYKQQRLYTAKDKGTIYGIHFQEKNHPQAKMIHCLAGKGIDYVVDLRKDSPTYKCYETIELCEDDDLHVYIPQGFGHAFLALVENTKILFSVDEYFYKESSRQIRYNDPQIGIDYPIEIKVLSKKDEDAPFLDELDYII